MTERRTRIARSRVRAFVARILSTAMPPDATNITTLLQDSSASKNPNRANEHIPALDEALTMLIAGIHSTSVWLAWTIKLIAADADLQADLQVGHFLEDGDQIEEQSPRDGGGECDQPDYHDHETRPALRDLTFQWIPDRQKPKTEVGGGNLD